MVKLFVQQFHYNSPILCAGLIFQIHFTLKQGSCSSKCMLPISSFIRYLVYPHH